MSSVVLLLGWFWILSKTLSNYSNNWQNKVLVMIFVGGGFSRSLFVFDVILFATSGIGLDDRDHA